MSTVKAVNPERPTDQCERCGKRHFIILTVEDSAGERRVCPTCWRQLQPEPALEVPS